MPARLHPREDTAYEKARDKAAAETIIATWTAEEGRVDAVASVLGLSRSTLYREIRRLEIGPKLPGFLTYSQ